MTISAETISRSRGTWRWREPSRLPGLGLTLGLTVTYLSLVVLLPLTALSARAVEAGWGAFAAAAQSPRVMSALGLSFGAAFVAALLNSVAGLAVAWVLVRYEFWGKRIVDALVDLPFAMPTAVSGIALAAIYAPNGWVGSLFKPMDIQIAYSRWGILIALMFIGLPFVVRTIQPAIEEIEAEVEEAAASLGASRWATFRRVVLPALVPAVVTGFGLALARGIGEYGSVIFIAGNRPLSTEIAPLLIMMRLEEFDYAGAVVIAVAMLVVSFGLLLGVNLVQWWWAKRISGGSTGAGVGGGRV